VERFRGEASSLLPWPSAGNAYDAGDSDASEADDGGGAGDDPIGPAPAGSPDARDRDTDRDKRQTGRQGEARVGREAGERENGFMCVGGGEAS
jgi:hypothetical protein